MVLWLVLRQREERRKGGLPIFFLVKKREEKRAQGGDLFCLYKGEFLPRDERVGFCSKKERSISFVKGEEGFVRTIGLLSLGRSFVIC